MIAGAMRRSRNTMLRNRGTGQALDMGICIHGKGFSKAWSQWGYLRRLHPTLLALVWSGILLLEHNGTSQQAISFEEGMIHPTCV